MYYYGYFRNIDDSVDKDGQLFKAVIFDEYSENGTVYPFEYDELTHTVLVPVDGVELTMVTSPFTVQYSSDSENIYKPYKCSTASVSFMQSELNKNLLAKSGRSVLVALLKWNNDVVFNEALQRYENTKTGAYLYKDTIIEQFNFTTVWEGFMDYKVDKFCYNVEWVGFATPETFSMGYNNIEDVFTLNCQDGLSVLQYEKFSKEPLDYLDSVGDVFTKLIADLGVYNHIYISDSLFVPSDGDNVLDKIFTQLPNYFDEDNEPCSKLQVLEEICRTLSLSMVAYGDNLYIIDYNAIANNANIYHHYQLSLSIYFFNIFQGRNFTYQGTKLIEHTHNIDGDSFSLTGTNISTSNTYNSVVIEDDDYSIGNIIPNIEDNETIDVDNEVNIGQHYSTVSWTEEVDGETVTKYEYWLIEGFSYDFVGRTADEVFDKGVMFAYNYNPDEWWNNNGSPWYGFSYEPLTGNNRINYSDFGNYIGCCVLDYHVCQNDTDTALPMDYNLKRSIYFHTPRMDASQLLPNNYSYDRYIQSASQPLWNDRFHPLRYYPHYNQKLLTVKSKNVLISGINYFQISGKWTFFNKLQLYVDSHHTTFWNQGNLENKAWSNYSAIYAMVKCYINSDVYYLDANLQWQTTSTVSRLPLEFDYGEAVWGISLPFQRNKRGIDGICIPTPLELNDSDICYLEIDIYRPCGVCRELPLATLLDDFEINLLSKDYVDSMGQTNADENNTEYKQELFNTAVCDYQGITLKATTTFDKEPNYSHLICKPYQSDTHYKVLNQDLCNIYSGFYGKPEELLINNIVQEYKKPVVKLDCNLHYNLGFLPISNVTWNTQFENTKFIIDSMNIDFEMNRNQISLVEKPTEMDLNDIYIMNVQRQRRRNGELNTIDRVRGAKKVLTRDSSIASGKVFGINYTSGIAYEGTNNAGAERFIQFRTKFMEGDLIGYVPNLLDDDIQVEIDNNYLIIKEI